MPKVFIAGEDKISRDVLRRIIDYCNAETQIFQEFPARGSKIFGYLPQYNQLAQNFPGIVCIDLDDKDCPLELLNELVFSGNKSDNLCINIPVAEVESWLLADRQGFANFLNLSVNNMPESKITTYSNSYTEIQTNVKPSLYIMYYLAQYSRTSFIKKELTPKQNAKKGPLYNTIMSEFVNKHWQIEEALHNSSSLQKCINRIESLLH